MSKRRIKSKLSVVRTTPPPVLHSINDVDLSKADAACPRCKGTGVSGWRDIPDPTHAGQSLRVAVVCACVTRGGGIRPDAMAQAAQRIQNEIDANPGAWGARLAADVQKMPVEYRAQAVAGLRDRASLDTVPEQIKHELRHAADILDNDPDFLTRPAAPPQAAVMPEALGPAEGDTDVDPSL